MSPMALSNTLREVLDLFDDDGEPRTAADVADQFGLDRQRASERLDRLVDHGWLETKNIGESRRIWWRPSANGRAAKTEPDAQQGLFRALVDATEEYAIFLLDPEGRVQTWNTGAERIKGYEADEIIGEHFATFYTEEDRAAGVPETNLLKAAQNGSIEDEGWRVRADGSTFWAAVTMSTIRGDGGEIDGYAKVTREMTDRREYERRLEEQADRLTRQRDAIESELDDVFDRISDGFYAFDDELRFRYLNDHAADVLGVDETVIGADVRDEVVLTEAFENALYDALESQTAVTVEDYYDPVDGWFYNAIYPSESGLSVYFREITERKRREKELARYETIVETSPVGITIVSDDGELQFANDRAEAIFGRERDQISALRFDDPDWGEVGEDGDVLSCAELPFVQIIESGEPIFDQISGVLRPSGERVWISVNGAPVYDDRGDIDSVVFTIENITERKTHQRKLEESNERLEQFAYAVSHDLQEPLRMVSSYVQLIDQRYGDTLGDDGQEFLAFAVDGAERMRQMIDGLLAYSRVETQTDSFEPVSLDAVCETVCEDLQIRIDETDADITADELPTVPGDASQLRQVFQNLLDNAIEYSGDEPPRIDITAERTGDRCHIAFHDQGIGIDPDDHGRVFELFQRLHTSDEHHGTGIGLAVCQRIVERHNGELWVESESGDGATFCLTLPVTQ